MPDPQTAHVSADLTTLLMGGGGGTATGVALTLFVQRLLEKRNGGTRSSLSHLEAKMDTMIQEQRKTNEHLSHLGGYLEGVTKSGTVS